MKDKILLDKTQHLRWYAVLSWETGYSMKILRHETGFQKKPLRPQTPLNWQQQSNPPFKFLDQNKDPPKMKQKLGQYPA